MTNTNILYSPTTRNIRLQCQLKTHWSQICRSGKQPLHHGGKNKCLIGCTAYTLASNGIIKKRMCVKGRMNYQMLYVHSPQLSLSLRCFAIMLSVYPSVCPVMSDPSRWSCVSGLGGCPVSTKTMHVSQEDDGAFIPSLMQMAVHATRGRCCLLFPSCCKVEVLTYQATRNRLDLLWKGRT